MIVDGQARIAALAAMAARAPQIRCRVSVNRSDFFGHFVGASGGRNNWKNKAVAMAKTRSQTASQEGIPMNELTTHALGILRIANPEARVLIINTDEMEIILYGMTYLEARNDEWDKQIDAIREKLNVQRNSHSG